MQRMMAAADASCSPTSNEACIHALGLVLHPTQAEDGMLQRVFDDPQEWAYADTAVVRIQPFINDATQFPNLAPMIQMLAKEAATAATLRFVISFFHTHTHTLSLSFKAGSA